MNLIELNEISSTQTWLINEDSDISMSEFSVAYTENQTSGRGQGSNKWESERGKNVCFSLLLRPEFLHPSSQFILTEVVSLAICDTLQDYIQKKIWIKWPNDIYVGEKKICGMLIQNKLLGCNFAAAYCGIGINVNQTVFSFAPNPTSIFLESNREVEPKNILISAVENIEKRYSALKNNTINGEFLDEYFSDLEGQYLSHLLFLNQWRDYLYKGEKIYAKILGVNNFGHLNLLTSTNREITAELKELKFLF